MTEPPASKPSSEPASAGASTTPASPSEATASAGASTTSASPSEATASAGGSTAPASPSEATVSLITEEKVWQFLKEKWEILGTRIMIEVERVDQLSKKSWKWRYCVKFPLTIIMVVMEPVLFLINNLIYCRRILWGFIKNSEERDPDKFWEQNSYNVIRAFGTLGVVVLLVLVVLYPLFRDTSENGGIPEKEIVRNTYYLLIFIGAGIAAAIATWRGRQFERQLANSRFEKAIDMATDPTSEIRRGSGFRILLRMFFTLEENFDTLEEEHIAILVPLITHNFKLSEKKERKGFKKLYMKGREFYDKNSSNDLFDKTHVPIINTDALDLWRGLVRKNQVVFNNPLINGISTSKVESGEIPRYIFSGMALRGIQFLVRDDDGQILPPTDDMYANFRKCCFILTDMHRSDVSYVDFSESHLERVNCINEREDCNMKCIGTNFQFANLIDCNFRGADFEDAFFSGTNITGSDFRLAKNLTPEQIAPGVYWIKPDNLFITQAKPKFPSDFPPGFADMLWDRRPEP